MSKFVVVIFADEAKAYEGVRALKDLDSEGALSLYSSAMVQRSADGNVAIKQKQDDGPIGTAVGGLVGGLVGLLGGPAGAAVGLGAGSAFGALRDLFNLGVSDDFLEAVSRELAPSKTAVVAEVSEEWVTPLDARMEALGGSVIREVRDDFVADQIEKRVGDYKAEVAQRRQERAAAKAEKMEAKLAKEVGRAEEKLRAIADKARKRVEDYRAENYAKSEKLREQARKAAPEARSRIEVRIAETRIDEEQRIGKLEQAYRIMQEALRS